MTEPAAEPLTVEVRRVRLGDIRLLASEENARFMTPVQFKRLVENVRHDGCLTSVPLLHESPGDDKLTCLSGNHRVKAALEALGADTEVDAQVVLTELPPSRALALQLSHNAVVGQDDPSTLKRLYDRLDEIDWRAYSGLDDKTLATLAEITVPSLPEARIDYSTVLVAFLPDELDRAKAALSEARRAAGSVEEVWTARFGQHHRVLEALDTAGTAAGTKTTAVAFDVILSVFETHVTDLQTEWITPDGEPVDDRRWVPIVSTTGVHMPAGAAVTVNRAIRHLIDTGEAGFPWQALELICADYLAGVKEENGG